MEIDSTMDAQVVVATGSMSEVRVAEPRGFAEGANNSEMNQQHTALTRRMSTPARFKVVATDDTDSLQHLRREHRYSQQDGKHPVNRGDNGSASNKLATSSSAASDSAFSQSQTTLQSEECGQSSDGCFRNSLEKVSTNYRNQRSDSDSLASSNNEHQIGEDHFKIVWRNLRYRVPDKRFARITSYLQRQKDALWPTEEEEREIEDSALEIERNPSKIKGASPVASTTHPSDESPPMRAPVFGKPRKVIFSDLNGCVKSGQLTAILGPSGGGKTTFLKCLTNNLVEGVSGSIDITSGLDKPTAPSQRHLKLCIIPQKDYLFDNLTVMENLIFASRIKNTQANFNHKQNVEHVAYLLGLNPCLKLKTRKLSGGQYKRLSIAQELLSKPDILILDEPTSGLDSLTCFKTVSVLRDLVDMSRAGLMPPLAIVITIHQPQIKVFNLFHHVYILSSLGKCVYEGRPEYLIDTVADCCKLLPPPDDLNPASFIIDLASEVYGTKPIDQLTDLQRKNFHLAHSKSGDGEASNDNIKGKVSKPNNNLGQVELFVGVNLDKAKEELGIVRSDREDYDGGEEGELKISDRLRKRNNHNGSFWFHTRLLINRLWISTWRDPLLFTTRLTFHLIIPFVFYFIYSQKSGAANACPHVEREFDFQTMTSDANVHRLETQHNELILTFENVSLFFILLYSFSMCVLAVTALSFPLNMQILLKETGNGWYSMPRFVMAKTIADLPMELTMPMISVSLVYWLSGQPNSYLCWRMLTVTAVMTLCSLISQTQGLLFGAYFMNNVQAAVFVSQASSLPWIMLSGFTTRVSELPTILQWLSYGSIYRIGIESIVAVRYGFGTCPCDRELVNETPPRIVGIPDQLRSVMRYYLDMYSDSATSAGAATGSPTNSTEDIFEKIASTLSRASTYGVNIVNCHDVRPFILSAREVDEGTLPTFLLILVSIFVSLKILLFWVVRIRSH